MASPKHIFSERVVCDANLNFKVGGTDGDRKTEGGREEGKEVSVVLYP